MGKILRSKKPTGSSELDFFFKEIWDAIENKLPLIDKDGQYTVEQTSNGQRLNIKFPPAKTVPEARHPFQIYNAGRRIFVKKGEVIHKTGQSASIGTGFYAPGTDDLSSAYADLPAAEDGKTYLVWLTFSLPYTAPSFEYVGVVISDIDDDLTVTSLASQTVYSLPPGTNPHDSRYSFYIGNIEDHADGSLTINQFQVEDMEIRDPSLMITGASVGSPDVVFDSTTVFVGNWKTDKFYYAGDTVIVDFGSDRYHFLLWPSSDGLYSLESGPVLNLDPLTNNPEPWYILSKSAL